MGKMGPVKQLGLQRAYKLVCFSSLNNAEPPLSDFDKEGVVTLAPDKPTTAHSLYIWDISHDRPSTKQLLKANDTN